MFNRILLLTTILSLILINSVIVVSVNITVDNDGLADYKSIQSAIDSANEGDIIRISAGVYAEHIRIYKNNITLQGEGQNLTRIEYDSGEMATVVVENVISGIISGLTIANLNIMPTENPQNSPAILLNGSKYSLIKSEIIGTRGMGIVAKGGEIEIKENVIQKSQTGVYLSDSASAIIDDNQISQNDMYGVYVKGSRVLINHNLIMDNRYGIAFLDKSEGTILNNIIYRNESDGVWCRNASLEISHSTIAENPGRGIFIDNPIKLQIHDNIIFHSEYGIYSEKSLYLVPEYNDIYQNYNDYYNCEAGITDISVNPMFVNISEADFRLFEGSQLIGTASDGTNIGAMTEIAPLIEAKGIVSVWVERSPISIGNSVKVNMIGEVSGIASFSIDGIVENVKMNEFQSNKYQGEYQINWGDVAYDQPIKVGLVKKENYENDEARVTIDGSLIQSIQINGSPVYFGQSIEVILNGMPNSIASFIIYGYDGIFPMEEISSGVYQGIYKVRWEDSIGRHFIKARLANSEYYDEENGNFNIIHGILTSVEISGSPAKADETISIKATGESGANVTADIIGIAYGIPLYEKDTILYGIYEGLYKVKDGENVSNGNVIIHFAYNSNLIEIQANQHITIDTIAPVITNPEISKTRLQNGDTFKITLYSEENAVVTVDLSMLDKTKGIVYIPEVAVGKYSADISISKGNLTINGIKFLKFLSRDLSGNEYEASLQVELWNSIANTQQLTIFGHIVDASNLLNDSAKIIVYNEAMRSEMETSIDNKKNYSVTFSSSKSSVAQSGSIIYVSLIDGSEVKASASHYISKDEIDNKKANVDLAIIQLKVDPKTLPSDGYSMALIEIRGLPKMPFISTDIGMIEQLSFDKDSGTCIATYIAGTKPGSVNLTVFIDGNTVATDDILLKSGIEDISGILLKSLSNRVLVGKSTHITGVIFPPFSRTPISLEVFSPKNLSWLEYTETQNDGSFDIDLRFDEPGTWRIKAFHNQSSSSVVVIHVEDQSHESYLDGTWKTYTKKDGLGNNTVNFMLEDSHGNLWAGTTGGVSKLEGETWKSYTTEYGLLSNHITFLLESKYGDLWAGTWGGGVSILNGEAWNSYTTAQGLGSNHITFLLEDSLGILWIGTWDGGLCKLEKGKWQSYTTESNSGLKHNYITYLLEDSRSNLWIATWGGGISRLNGDKWRPYTKADGLRSNYIRCILEDNLGNIWAGTEGGISKLCGDSWVTDTTQNGLMDNHIKYILQDRNGILWTATELGISRLEGKTWKNYSTSKISGIDFILEDAQGYIWITTDNGMSKLKGETWKNYTTINGLGDNLVNYLLEDSHGVLWAGTKNGGVSKLELETYRIYTTLDGLGSNSTRFLLEGNYNDIWAITEDGLSRLDGGKWVNYAINGLKDDNVNALLKDKNGVLWAGTDAGLSKFDGKKWVTHAITNGLSVEFLLEDRFGNIWIGTWGKGVINLEDNILKSYTIADGLGGDLINFLLEGSDGTIWAATGHEGLSKFEGGKWRKLATNFGTEGNWLNFLFDDKNGNLWAGLAAGGLVRLDGENLRIYSVTNGLGGDLVNFLLEDNYGTIWAATDGGVSRLEGSTWQTFTTKNGLGDNYVNFLLEDSDGNIWAATTDGISRFDKDTNFWFSPFSGTNCRHIIEDQRGILWIATDKGVFRYESNTISPQTKIIEGPNGVVGKSSVSFGYLGEDLDTSRGKLIYSWKLDNQPWTPFTSSTFTGISVEDGVHTFYVRSSDNEGNIDYTPAKRIFRVDTTSPISIIEKPSINQIICGEYEILGTAIDDTDFDEYEVTVTPESNEDIVFRKLVKHKIGRLGAGGLLATWNTREVKDDIYIIALTVRDKVEGYSDISHVIKTIVTVAVDNTLPVADFSAKDNTPNDNILSGMIQIDGYISDKYLAGYRIEYAKGISGPSIKWEVIEQSIEPISESYFVIQKSWSSISVGGEITLKLMAIDKAGNEGVAIKTLTLINENPKLIAKIDKPTDGEVIWGKANIVIFPSPEINLKQYKITLNEIQQDIWNQNEVKNTNDLKVNWNTALLNDGKYTIRLTATDSEGFISTHEIEVIVDNTNPIANITSPFDNAQVGGIVSIAGTATDANFRDYIIEYGEGSKPVIWIEASEDARRKIDVQESKLFDWLTLNKLGIFTLRLTVRDFAEHTSQDFVTVEILPPIKSQQGGNCISNDGLMKLYIPPRALLKDEVVTINRILKKFPSSNNDRSSNLAYDINPLDLSLNPIKPATLQIELRDLVEQDGKRIAFFRWESKWTLLGGTIKDNKLIMGIAQFGHYAVMEVDENTEPSYNNFVFTCQPRVLSPGQSATISFNIQKANYVTVKIYDLEGRLQKTVLSEAIMYGGYNACIWDGNDEHGKSVPSGPYLITLEFGKQKVKTKTIVVRNR